MFSGRAVQKRVELSADTDIEQSAMAERDWSGTSGHSESS